jgi:hypothetical protein
MILVGRHDRVPGWRTGVLDEDDAGAIGHCGGEGVATTTMTAAGGTRWGKGRRWW